MGSSFPEPPELCMQQPEDNEDINSEVVHRSYFSPDEIDNFDNNNCPPNTTPFGYKCVPLCKESHQQLQKTEAATFEIATSSMGGSLVHYLHNFYNVCFNNIYDSTKKGLGGRLDRYCTLPLVDL
ncbi:hypothetical protein NQ317_016053 [Molorchus minor]|uniref:Uncharacterized protein n=1 Tax=Molorchus minor TaxID=1323400 RepID=A0ABQ9JQJ7_9CUCU|nr:hypothetical protein NQ317_016053 [Molorchus minor]